jgi:hypothetical protein
LQIARYSQSWVATEVEGLPAIQISPAAFKAVLGVENTRD